VAPERYNAGLLAEAEELPDGDELGAPSLRVLCARWETSNLNSLLFKRRTSAIVHLLDDGFQHRN